MLTTHLNAIISYRFYRGLTPTLYREMPGYFFFFGGYEYTREFLKKPDQKKEDIGLVRTMIAGSVGGICLWTVIFPADVIKSRMQVNNIQMNMFTMGANIVRNEGVGRFLNIEILLYKVGISPINKLNWN